MKTTEFSRAIPTRVHLFRNISFLVFFIHLLHCSLAVRSSLLLPGMYLTNKYNLCDWLMCVQEIERTETNIDPCPSGTTES